MFKAIYALMLFIAPSAVWATEDKQQVLDLTQHPLGFLFDGVLIPQHKENKMDSQQANAHSPSSNSQSGPLWQRFAYGGGTLLVTAGPVLAGVDEMTWVAEFMGINVAILIGCCLLATWKNLRGPTPSSRRR